jgi:hypothetical protein
MNIVKRSLLLTLLIALGAGCHIMHDEIPGSGKIVKENRSAGTFTSISTEGAFEVVVVCQKPQSIEIEGDDNILPLVTTEVSNNVLHIKNLRGYSVREPITLRISVPTLEGVYASGAGTFEVSGLQGDKFEIDATGAPTIRASGDTKNLKVDVTGAGKIDAHRLHAARVEVDSKGVSNIEVNAAEQLDVTISGPSHVIYQGNAVVKKTINGPGSVEKKESEGS